MKKQEEEPMESDYRNEISVYLYFSFYSVPPEIKVLYFEGETWQQLEDRLASKCGQKGRLVMGPNRPNPNYIIHAKEMHKVKRFVYLPL